MSLLNSIVTSRISRGQRQWLNLVACGHCDPVRSCGNPPRGSDDAADGWLADAVTTRHLRRRLSSRTVVLDDIASLRSDARRVGKEGVSAVRSRWSPTGVKNKYLLSYN